jgi:hypothetical protein
MLDSPQKDSIVKEPKMTPAGGVYDRNMSSAFSKPRSSGGIPVKMGETISGSPGSLDSPMKDTIPVKATK